MSGDLISRSALLRDVNKAFDAFIHDAHFKAACDAIRAKRAVIRMLNDAPTVDAEVVRHGKWLEPYKNDIWDCYKCSECGATFDRTTKYCSGCGARMDAEVEG